MNTTSITRTIVETPVKVTSRWDTLSLVMFHMASYLTDPVCACRSYYYSAQMTLDGKAPICTDKAYYYAGMTCMAPVAVITAPLGIVLRYLARKTMTGDFHYAKGKLKEQELGDNLVVVSANVCGVVGGYEKTDGGVIAWYEKADPKTGETRLDLTVKNLLAIKGDVVCLQEAFDVQFAAALMKRLRKHYAHFYYNIGPTTLGTGSGLFVASKVRVNNPRFREFPDNIKHGRAKKTRKGVFVLPLGPLDIHVTHLQHHETPGLALENPTNLKPTKEEKAYAQGERKARAQEVRFIVADIDPDKPSMIIGDLNAPSDEIGSVLNPEKEEKKGEEKSSEPRFRQNVRGGPTPTWGGDLACKRMTGSKASVDGQDLDQAWVQGDIEFETIVKENGYDQTRFLRKALSDHKPIVVRFNLQSISESKHK